MVRGRPTFGPLSSSPFTSNLDYLGYNCQVCLGTLISCSWNVLWSSWCMFMWAKSDYFSYKFITHDQWCSFHALNLPSHVWCKVPCPPGTNFQRHCRNDSTIRNPTCLYRFRPQGSQWLITLNFSRNFLKMECDSVHIFPVWKKQALLSFSQDQCTTL